MRKSSVTTGKRNVTIDTSHCASIVRIVCPELLRRKSGNPCKHPVEGLPRIEPGFFGNKFHFIIRRSQQHHGVAYSVAIDEVEEGSLLLVIEKLADIGTVRAGHCRDVSQFEVRIKIDLPRIKQVLDF